MRTRKIGFVVVHAITKKHTATRQHLQLICHFNKVINNMTTPLKYFGTPCGILEITGASIADIVGRREHARTKVIDYCVRLANEKDKEWYQSYKGNFDSLTDWALIIKKNALDGGKDIKPVEMILDDNKNGEIYGEFIRKYKSDTRDEKAPSWDRRDYYKGLSMRIVKKITCRCKFPDGMLYYLVEWGYMHSREANWLDRDELSNYINIGSTKMVDFNIQYNALEDKIESLIKRARRETFTERIDRYLIDNQCNQDDDDDDMVNSDGYNTQQTEELKRFHVTDNRIEFYPEKCFEEDGFIRNK